MVKVALSLWDESCDAHTCGQMLRVNDQARVPLLVARRLRSAAAVSVPVKPKTKSAANGNDHSNIVGHGEQHEVVGVEAVQRVKDCALHAVQSVLGSSFARNSGLKQGHFHGGIA